MEILDRNMKIVGDPEEYDFETCLTRTNRDIPIVEHDIVAAMIKHRGNYAQIAAELGRSRNVVFNHIGRNDQLRALRDDIRQALLDMVEDGVFQSAMMGDGAQQRFLLTTLAKDRGFVTREERSGPDGGPLHLKSNIDVKQLDDETLLKLMNAGRKPE